MQQGDLVYIPSEVYLFDKNNFIAQKTEKPMVGVFMGETDTDSSRLIKIFAQGRGTMVEKKYVYPMGGQNGTS
jgi:hypothetical protein